MKPPHSRPPPGRRTRLPRPPSPPTRIHDGPHSSPAGGDYGTSYLDLTHIPARRCTAIHPVVVLVDQHRALKPSQPRLDFYDGTSARPYPVHFDRTDEAELVGAFDD